MALSNFHLVMSVPVKSLGEMCCLSRKGGTGGSGLVHSKGEKGIGSRWVGHFSPPLGVVRDTNVHRIAARVLM